MKRLIAAIGLTTITTACHTIAPKGSAPLETPPIATVTDLSNATCQTMIASNVMVANAPIGCDRLRTVTFSYHDMNGETQPNGQFVILDVLAPDLASAMDALLAREFSIEKARLMEVYDGNDDASMDDNNSSGFNARSITGGTRWSTHAYGAAIDINPIQNPYVRIDEDGTAQVKPAASARYALNRNEIRPNKSPRLGMAEGAVDILTEHGFFVWGGDWDWPLDYQHFQAGPRSYIEALVNGDFASGRAMVLSFRTMYSNCKAAHSGTSSSEQIRKTCSEEVIKAMP